MPTRKKSRAKSRTTTSRGADRGPSLVDVKLGLSVSNPAPTELVGLDLTPADLNRFAVRLARVFLARGGSVVSGHDWRPAGIMRAFEVFAAGYRPEIGGVQQERPTLVNFVPWPLKTGLDNRQLAKLGHVLQVENLDLPKWARTSLPRCESFDGNDRELAKMQGLFALRRRLTDVCTARVCLGGKTTGFGGRYPGVLEEAAMAIEKGSPVYLVGFAGGATRRMIELLRAGSRRHAAELVEQLDDDEVLAARRLAFEQRRAELQRAGTAIHTEAGLPDCLQPWSWDNAALVDLLRGYGDRFDEAGNGLSKDENRALWDTANPDEAIDLVLRGLARATGS